MTEQEPPSDLYWSERTQGVPVADQETVGWKFWLAFVGELQDRYCDQYGSWGGVTDKLLGEVHIAWPPEGPESGGKLPETSLALDCVEFD